MMIRRAQVTDFFADDGQSVVLVDARIMRLGPIATAIMEILEGGPLSAADLESALVARFGAPPDQDATQAVAAQLEELAAHGLVDVDA